MKIVTVCEKCLKKLQIDAAALSKKARCPACKEIFLVKEVGSLSTSVPFPAQRTVPAPTRPPVPQPPVEEDRPRTRPSTPPRPTPPPVETEPAMWEDDDTPVAPRRKPAANRRSRDEEIEEEKRPAPKPKKPRKPAPVDDEELVLEEDDIEVEDDDAPSPKVKPRSQMGLRVLVLLCGLVGGGIAGAMGYLYSQEYEYHVLVMDAIAKLGPLMPIKVSDKELFAKETSNVENLSFMMYAASALGLIAGVLGFLRVRLLPGLLLILSVVPPAVLLVSTLLFNGTLLWGGLISLLIRSKSGALAAALRTEGRDRKKQASARQLAMVGHFLAYAVFFISTGLGIVGILAFSQNVEKHQKWMNDIKPLLQKLDPKS